MRQEHDFRIDVKTLEKQLLCNVCFNDIQDCYITRCGHIYCKACIFEAINRHQRCPFCNVTLTDNDVFKNYHFNTLFKIIQKEKQVAVSQYLSKIFEQEKATEQALLKPIEEAILKSAQMSLLMYRNFVRQAFQGLKTVEEKKSTGLRTTEEIIREIHKNVLPQISQPVLSPLLLQQRVLINFPVEGPLKNIPISHQITSMTPITLLLSILQKHLTEHNFRLVAVKNRDDIRVRLDDMVFRLDDVLGQSVIKLANNSVRMEIDGYQCLRNIECFTYKWFKGKSVNYYSCTQCNMNWICEVCKDFCHEGHPYTIQLLNNVPNWACCYCVTKCDCKALNKNSS